MTDTRIETTDIALFVSDPHVSIVDDELILTSSTVRLHFTGTATERVRRELASTTPSVVAELARVQEENRLLRAELDRAHRIVPSAGLAQTIARLCQRCNTRYLDSYGHLACPACRDAITEIKEAVS